ncbi:MAG: hypothetical protein O7H41_18075 [Planctomycetota bacterium]|nr:hypothetical protein [Planctomycetota bacterium]
MFGSPKVKIDPELFEKAKEAASRLGYASVEEFITHLIETAIGGDGEAESDREIQERLKGLGYIS